jgi:hypothetical protein
MSQEFWEEETRDDRELAVKQILRWALIFVLLFAGVLFAFWWAGSAIHFGASRVNGATAATYRVFGSVRSAATQQPVPWAAVEDDSSGRPPFFRAEANHLGVYELMTIAEPHQLRVSALGFKPATAKIGRIWYLWMPEGAESLDVLLQPE